MSDLNNPTKAKSWALNACDYQNTREIFKTSNPMVHMLIVLLLIFLIFCARDLMSEPATNAPLAYLEESSDDVVYDEGLPGPDDPVATDRAPELIYGPSPGYPLDALKAGKTGTVWVKALVDDEGKVRRAIVEKESGEDIGFEEAALEAALMRKYRPAEYENEPVAVWVSYEVSFHLKKR